MQNINELRKQLAEAENLEKLKSLQIELDDIRKLYEGKCFASHTFERNTAALSISATYYEKFYIKENKIYVLEKSINLYRCNNFYKPSKVDISYSRHYYERCLFDNEYSAQHILYSGYIHFRKEISIEIFEQLWTGSEDCSLIIKDIFHNKLPEVRMELIRQGDSHNEDTIESGIEKMKLDIIDFKKYPEIYRCIEYTSLPMFQNSRWMPKIFARQILEYHIDNLTKRIHERFVSVRMVNALLYEVNIIQNFINKNL